MPPTVGLLRDCCEQSFRPSNPSRVGGPAGMVLGLLVAFIAHQTTRPIVGRPGVRVRVRGAAHKRHAIDRCQTLEVLGI